MNLGSLLSNKYLDLLRQKRVGEIVQVFYDEIQGELNLPTVFLTDDTIPQITEGDEIFNINFIPKKIGNILLLEVSGYVAEKTNVANSGAFSLFQDGGVNAIASGGCAGFDGGAGTDGGHGMIKKRIITISLNPINFIVRAGNSAGGANTFLNVFPISPTSRNLGNTIVTAITIHEIEQ